MESRSHIDNFFPTKITNVLKNGGRYTVVKFSAQELNPGPTIIIEMNWDNVAFFNILIIRIMISGRSFTALSISGNLTISMQAFTFQRISLEN